MEEEEEGAVLDFNPHLLSLAVPSQRCRELLPAVGLRGGREAKREASRRPPAERPLAPTSLPEQQPSNVNPKHIL